MNQQMYNLISGLFFCAISLLHLYRAIVGSPVIVAEFDIPMWVSWVAAVVTGFLGFTALRFRSASSDS